MERPCLLRMRADLQVVRQAARARLRWLVKDPIALRYYQLSDEEYAVLRMLDGNVLLRQVKEAIEAQFPPRIATLQQLQSLLQRFYEWGLVYGESGAQSDAAASARRGARRRRWLGQLANPLFIKFPGFDPAPLLDRLYPLVRWMFRLPGLLAAATLIAVAACVLAVNVDGAYLQTASLGQLLQAGNLFWLLLAMAGAKALHELGHALACKHFGGECHEIGVALFVFMPCLYCDATDAWMIPDKWKRAAVGAAGMAVELLLAAACVLVWRFSQPGMIHALSLNTIVVCTVSTLLFNGNPLVRFDGYYILSDLAEAPNLQQSARHALLQFCQRHLLGMEPVVAPLPGRTQFWLIAYAVAAFAYRAVLTLGIFLLLRSMLRPYGLQQMGDALMVAVVAAMAVSPISRLARFARRPGNGRRFDAVRTTTTCVVIAALAAVFVLAPLPRHVHAPLVLEPRGAERIYVTVPGVLEEVYAKPGERVAAGAPLARLANLDVAVEVARLAAERDRLELHLRNLSRRQGRDRDAADAIPVAQVALADLTQQLHRRREDESRLLLTTSQGGVVSEPPRVPPGSAAVDSLPPWSGTPLDRENDGCHLEVGTLLAIVGEPQSMDALLFVDQTAIEFVREGQLATIQLSEYRGRPLEGRIDQISQIDADAAPPVLSHKAGGELSTVAGKSGVERPLRVAYQARVRLPESNLHLLPGYHGRAVIAAGSEPLGRRFLRFLRSTFLF